MRGPKSKTSCAPQAECCGMRTQSDPISSSQRGMSAVLNQKDDEGNEYLVACISRSCNEHERNYGSYKGEMCAAVWGVRSFHTYLQGAQLTLHTDHRGLTWLLQSRDMQGQYARWAVLLSPYTNNLTISYKPGVTHQVADVPSRMPLPTTADTTGVREAFDPPGVAKNNVQVITGPGESPVPLSSLTSAFWFPQELASELGGPGG
jgi:hypothetical protein